MPMRRWPGGTSLASTSSNRTWPESGGMSPAMILRRVVLPQPLGPSTTMVLPSGILRLRSRIEKVSLSRRVLHTSTRSMRAMGLVERGQRGGEIAQDLPQTAPHAGDVLVRFLRNAAARDMGDELVAAGGHQEGGIDLDLERVDAPGPRLAERRHDVPARIARHVLVHLEAVAGEDCAHRGSELGRAGRVMPGADDHLVVLHPARAPRVAVEEQRMAMGL